MEREEKAAGTQGEKRERERENRTSVVEAQKEGWEGKPINFTMANSETVATPFLQFTEVIKV